MSWDPASSEAEHVFQYTPQTRMDGLTQTVALMLTQTTPMASSRLPLWLTRMKVHSWEAHTCMQDGSLHQLDLDP